MNQDIVLVEIHQGTAWVFINRDDKLNALSTKLVATLHETMRNLDSDDNVRVIVITGSGQNFSVGYDVVEEVKAGVTRAEDWHTLLTKSVDLTMAIWTSSKPTIAAVDGWCLGGGCELAMACDLTIATDRAQFGEPEIRFGSSPVTLLMPFLIGQKKTNELLLTGDVISAREAERIGMINQIVPADALREMADKKARKISLTPAITLHFTKIALTRAYEAMGLRTAVNANIDVAATLNAAHSPEKAEFLQRVQRDGLRTALNWRDSRYGQLDASS